jgi:hypothetical protein
MSSIAFKIFEAITEDRNLTTLTLDRQPRGHESENHHTDTQAAQDTGVPGGLALYDQE